MPSPLHLIALTQVALNRWLRAIIILLGPPLIIDGILLLLTALFYQLVPRTVVQLFAYVGGVVLICFACFSLAQMRRQTHEEMAHSATLTYAAVSVAALAELAAPGTWVYWLTIAGPILAEGHQKGYWMVVPFFAGSLVGYYGAAIVSVKLLAWGAGLHKKFNEHLLLLANLLLLILGISYLVRTFLQR